MLTPVGLAPLVEPREEPELRVGTEAPKRRRTRMIDVDIR